MFYYIKTAVALPLRGWGFLFSIIYCFWRTEDLSFSLCKTAQCLLLGFVTSRQCTPPPPPPLLSSDDLLIPGENISLCGRWGRGDMIVVCSLAEPAGWNAAKRGDCTTGGSETKGLDYMHSASVCVRVCIYGIAEGKNRRFLFAAELLISPWKS